MIKERNPNFKAIAVEPVESPVITQTREGQTIKPGPHKLQGIGAGFVPDNLDMAIVDEVIEVSTEDSVRWSRRCAVEEGILIGLSSGAAVSAALQVAHRPENAGKTIVAIIPSNGERYLSTILFADLRDE